jgi:predicted amidohydrolase YtcJ
MQVASSMTGRPTKLRVFTAERIHTMDPGRPHATAVAVADGSIVSVGSLDSMQPWLRRLPHEIDDRYDSRVLLPGFIDPHTHLRLSGTFAGLTYVGPVEIGSPGALSPLASPPRSANSEPTPTAT